MNFKNNQYFTIKNIIFEKTCDRSPKFINCW